MNNTNQHLFAIYNNIHSFYEYRKLYPLEPQMKQDAFIKKIQNDKFLIMPSIKQSLITDNNGNIDKDLLANANDMHVVIVVLVYVGTECENKSANMAKMLSKITHESAEVIIITPVKVSTGILRKLSSMSIQTKKTNKVYKSFTYTLFNSILPNHDLVPKYEILSKEQIEKELSVNYVKIDTMTLPKIFENDPQMVWLGASVGDIIKFTMLSEITIEAIGYCIVIPSPQIN